MRVGQQVRLNGKGLQLLHSPGPGTHKCIITKVHTNPASNVKISVDYGGYSNVGLYADEFTLMDTTSYISHKPKNLPDV